MEWVPFHLVFLLSYGKIFIWLTFAYYWIHLLFKQNSALIYKIPSKKIKLKLLFSALYFIPNLFLNFSGSDWNITDEKGILTRKADEFTLKVSLNVVWVSSSVTFFHTRPVMIVWRLTFNNMSYFNQIWQESNFIPHPWPYSERK